MLTRVYLDNYRCFSNFEWRPGKFVLLAGRNGSGKTTLMEAITGVARILHGEEALDKVFPESSLTRWERRKEQRIELDVTIPQGEFRYILRLDHAWKRGVVRIVEESLRVNDQLLFNFIDGDVHLYKDDGRAGPVFAAKWDQSKLKEIPEGPSNPRLSAFREALRQYWLVRPVPALMTSESITEDSAPDIELANFVGWYRVASDGRGSGVLRLMKSLGEIFEGFAGLNLEKTGGNARMLKAAFVLLAEAGQRSREVEFELNELSEGQRMLIALYALVEFGPVRDGLLCLDEPANYLAIEEIEPWLKELEAALDEGDGQVFISSHNGEVVNRLWASHGVWFERDSLGPVRIRPAMAAEGISPAELMARGWT